MRTFSNSKISFFLFQVPEVKLSFPIRQNIYIN